MKHSFIFVIGGVSAVFTLIIVLSAFMLASTSKIVSLSGKDFIDTYKSTENSVLLDVRTPNEHASSHIANAINIDFENQTFLAEIKKLDMSKTYFVYCRSGNRSGKAITIMKNNGFKNIYELRGGILSNIDSVNPVTASASNDQEYVVDKSDMVNGQMLTEGIKKSVLTKNEIDGLIQMREEEKLAHDVYVTLGSAWGVKTFSNISQSEQTHTDAVKVLLLKYEIKDPVTNKSVGVFQSKAMQDLYTSLVEKGKVSLTDALTVGALVEDLDIHDLDLLKAQTDKEDILVTYAQLQKGSRNHLRAFSRSLEREGATYAPKYISQNDYNTIITTPQERGR